jgi:16S rRNA (guanine527-N7)-methyltransferase
MFHVKHLDLESRVAAAAPDLPPEAVAALAVLVDRLTRADLNVTAIRDIDEAIERHVLDSLRALPLIDAAPPGSLVDVGSGGGVPALVIAATRDSRDVHAIEATGRKAAFIAETAEAMGIDARVRVHAARSEELSAEGSPWRDAFACVCARALAPPPVAVELCAPLCQTGGRIVLWTGVQADRPAIATAAAALAAELEDEELPGLTTLRKLDATPTRYPRRPGMAAKRPLA